MALTLRISAVDTWFFRGGVPYYNDGATWPGMRSVFPPYPWAAAGAVRAMLARCRGWSDGEAWTDEFKAVLGDGPENCGKLKFTGPFVLYQGQLVFPMPRHVVGGPPETATGSDCKRWQPKEILLPSCDRTLCDLGEVCLPKLSESGSSPTQRYWVKLDGLRNILNGNLPGDGQIVDERRLWRLEPRIGIRRDPNTRAAEEGALFAAVHVRPTKETEIALEVDGVPQDWKPPNEVLIPFGAEGRLALCRTENAPIDHLAFSDGSSAGSEHAGKFVLIALTPALISVKALAGAEELEPESGLKVVCACADRPIRVGGWFSLERKPLPLRNTLAAGSVLFCRAQDPQALMNRVDRGMLRLGEMTALGFGLFAIGKVAF